MGSRIVFRFLKGVNSMATKSILKTVRIKDKNLARNLVNALEHASEKTAKDVRFSKMCEEVKGEQIKEMFKEG